MTVLQPPRMRASSGATTCGRLLVLEQSDSRIHSLDSDVSDRKGEESSGRPVQAVHAFAPEGNSDLRSGPVLFAVGPAHAATPGTFWRGGLPAYVVRRVREYVESNIDQRIKVEALAKLANLSVCYFVRAFKQSVGFTPHDYLMRRRIQRTKELLSCTNMPLSEIALAAGFTDQSHCARRFRQHLGMSPREYRRAPR